MRTDDEVGKINAATPLLVSCALELFLKSIVSGCVDQARARGAKKVTASHLKAAINGTERFDFLKDLVANVPDPVEGEAEEEGKKKGRKRGAAAGSSTGGPSKRKAAVAAAAAVKEENETEEGEEDVGVKDEDAEYEPAGKASIANLLNDDDD
ncbi:hypothetical protein BCR33DRAFT_713215 [Rhizoclosmatium globosum]|uniref:Transcription factor CBF/NF-Y/archaeal histone domain-containing protein n=1 Tax=Rhizoclosmatium globosum TaxID=329046 RepID=A0A1Y2CU29_9FUNG|nr:hypothetical protein HDU79_007223 [Rhizoclosmatium sp. JEL0117]ORY50396.1 hypothetical protein BCR33DRAFT_713215 [Rhizoclosmatium globosum]|eukprot:ORY50396.1 hypothetical protein BCR33DRAFT_713215 [Rhizoclosmatium globosum]